LLGPWTTIPLVQNIQISISYVLSTVLNNTLRFFTACIKVFVFLIVGIVVLTWRIKVAQSTNLGSNHIHSLMIYHVFCFIILYALTVDAAFLFVGVLDPEVDWAKKDSAATAADEDSDSCCPEPLFSKYWSIAAYKTRRMSIISSKTQSLFTSKFHSVMPR
jgi:hypothetical protein